MTQLNNNFAKLLKSLKVNSKKEYLDIDNSKEIIEKAINRLYKNHLNRNDKSDNPKLESGIYQQYYSKLRAYTRDIGKPINFKIVKTPKNPSSSIVKIHSVKIRNFQELLDTIESEKSKENKEIDMEKIKSEVKVFLSELKEKSEFWFNFFLIKLNIGLDYSDIANLKIGNFEVYLDNLVYKTKRHKTAQNPTSFLSTKTIKYFLEYTKKLSKIHGINTNFNLFNSNSNSVIEYKAISSDNIAKEVKKITTNYIHSKDLRAMTKSIIMDNCGLDIVLKQVLSEIWLAHKTNISNQYTKQLRDGNFVYNLYKTNIESFFDDIIP